ncbi:MAG TPA: DUF4097 family beta strand repeat-containing protein [Pyrinomonadaceae bacterium]|nr:DUF4097 family beta strand repeat-containing protein [Pyrinomonadaceae bacterium]
MIVHCQNCGAEVAEGQRFCRLCGAEVRTVQEGELPTRILPGETQPGVPFTTSRLSPESRTDPVYHPRQTAPQTFASQPTSYPLQAAPPSGSSRTWLYILASLCVVGIILISLLIFASQSSLPSRVMIKKNLPPQPAPPSAPSSMGLPGAISLDENDADVTDSKTVITKTYPLQNGAAVSLKNVSGDIEVEGWDENQAEVTITKRGGAPQDRDAVRIIQIIAPNRLSLETPLVSDSNVEVQYRIKLPRGVAALAISSLNSEIKLSEINGSVAIDLQKGSIELQGIGGLIKAKTIKGNIKAELAGTKQKGSQEFSTVKGNVELQFDGEVNADIKAETVDGKIEVDDDFNLQVSKQPIGQHLAGHIGAGGDGILAKTVNGNIKLKK